MLDCKCDPRPKIETRSQPTWNPGQTLYGYGVSVLVLIHTFPCQLPDQVLRAEVIHA